MMGLIPDRLEDIVLKGQNTDKQHFLLLQLCFEKVSFTSVKKTMTYFPTVGLF